MELVHMKFCKMLLGVTKNASNAACRAELGRLSMKCKAIMRSLDYWLKFIDSESDPNKLSMQVYQGIGMK